MSGVNVEGTPVNSPKYLQTNDYYINEERIHELLISSQQPLAKELEEYLCIKIIRYKCVCKEAGTIYTIQKVFERTPMNQ